jgi:hypothetical protein
MASLALRLRTPASLWTAVALIGCGPNFDPPSEIDGLRVLGVQKSEPYARPDRDVELRLLYHDGASPDEASDGTLGGSNPRPISVAWLTGCWNPPGDSYAGCFVQFASGDAGAPNLEFGNRITLRTKPGPIQPRSAPNPDYDLSYVFFAVCAGTIAIDASAREGLPLRCRDASNRDLGSEDFVVGYSAIYVFAERSDGTPYANQNPEVTGFSLQGAELPGEASCVGDSCLADCSDPMGCLQTAVTEAENCGQEGAPACLPRLPRCKEDGDPIECPGYDIRPLYDLSKPAEPDQVPNDTFGRTNAEQMWINYYTTRGAVKSPVRLLNDATTQYNEDFGTEFYAPSTPGPVRVWAVVHDNRGGMSWAGAALYIE